MLELAYVTKCKTKRGETTMRLNVEYLQEILKQKQWSERQFALKAGLSPATVSRILSKKRGAGAKAIGAIRKALPEESLDKLFFLE
ncbi:helix-turn-helix domain-containing protein [Bacillus coahuilensis]|uniref:helix-turn-helix domain-containing protein n=1 Tax=Bacillus coahuilensis TaxID=408580 RepID=UPI001ED8E476|nr:helix-turn-helix transcriptional regulator [Bacillus coahuilensis]